MKLSNVEISSLIISYIVEANF